jgi:phosphoenolpyruvate synthase/pyruvate phosphate dikinase
MVTKILVTIMLFTNLVLSQTVYDIPFASQGNSIELTVANAAEEKIENIKVELKESPEWINFTKSNTELETIEGNTEKTALFTFSLGKEAPVGKETVLKFLVSGNNEKISEKEIMISVLPPDDFELFQNYPNPFNPTTKISFQLPMKSKIRLKIYNLLGEEVADLLNETREAGLHEVEWNASEYSSGLYIYQIYTEGKNSSTNLERKKMLLVK